MNYDHTSNLSYKYFAHTSWLSNLSVLKWPITTQAVNGLTNQFLWLWAVSCIFPSSNYWCNSQYIASLTQRLVSLSFFWQWRFSLVCSSKCRTKHSKNRQYILMHTCQFPPHYFTSNIESFHTGFLERFCDCKYKHILHSLNVYFCLP